MTDLTDQLDAIQARVDASTPGPWRWDENYGEDGDTGLALTNEAGAEIVGAYNHHCCAFRDDPSVEDNDAVLIANAPTDIGFLLDLTRKQQAAIDAVTTIPPIEHGIDADARFANGYNEALRRVREALEAKP